MGLFDSIFKKQAQIKELNGMWQTLTAYQPSFTTWRGELYESELVRSAIDAKARHISKLKVEVRGAAKPKLQTKLKQGPNEFQTWSQFLYRTSTILDMQNTAFIIPILDSFNEISGYFTVLPDRCTILRDKSNKPWLRYQFHNGQFAAMELERCGVLTKFQYQDDIFGTNNNALNNTISLIDMQSQGIKEAVRSSATYRFMAQASNFAKPEDLAKERQRFSKENFSSESKGGGLLLFPNTYTNIQQIKASPFTIDSQQMDIIQKNVYNYFGVNENVINNTPNSSGDVLDSFFNGEIEPFMIQLSEVMTKMTFSVKEKSMGSSILVTANRLQYMPVASKISIAQQLGDRGMITINEVRELFNYPLLPSEEGDKLPIRGEYYFVGEDREPAQKVIEGETDGQNIGEN